MIFDETSYWFVPTHAPAGLTVDNVKKALHGIHWRKVGEILRIPYTKLSEIKGEYHSDEEREGAVIRYWILRDPFASWRRIIGRLTDWEKHYHCDGIHHYREELTGMCAGHIITCINFLEISPQQGFISSPYLVWRQFEDG